MIVFTIFATFIANFGLYSNNSLIIAGSKLLAPILGPITYLLYDHNKKNLYYFNKEYYIINSHCINRKLFTITYNSPWRN